MFMRVSPPTPVFEYTPPSMLGWRSHLRILVRGFQLLPLSRKWITKTLGGLTRETVGASFLVAAEVESSYAAQRHDIKHITRPGPATLALPGITVTQHHVIEVRDGGRTVIVTIRDVDHF